MIVGYSVGNGMAALTNKPVEPIIRKKALSEVPRTANHSTDRPTKVNKTVT